MSRSTKLNQRKISLTTSKANRGARISNLPEGVIGHILSHLPTKSAVQTCVLSKDWEYKWTSIYNIDLNDRKTSRKGTKTIFANFVERILLLSQNVKSFHLSCWDKYDLNRMTAWISAVLRRNVESFELFYLHGDIVLPRCLLNCTSLRKLELKLPCTFKVPTENCFPNLKIMYLERVEILQELSSTDPLKFIFPVLKTFELKRCKWSNVKIVELHAPALTVFSSEPQDVARVNVYTIKIYGAKLVKFKSSSTILETFDMTNSRISYATLSNSFREDDLQLLEKSGLQVRMLLKGFSCLKELELSGNVAKLFFLQLCNGGLLKHDDSLLCMYNLLLSCLRGGSERYNSLERLVMSSSGSSEALLEILHASPHLKHLDMDVRYWDRYDYDAVRSVPSCISSSLEEVKFNFFDFSGKKSEFYLAKFLLKNAILLKKVHLSASSYGAELENEIVEELSTFPKSLVRCLTIVVT